MKNIQSKVVSKEKMESKQNNKKNNSMPSKEVFEKANRFFESNGNIFLFISIALMLLISLLLFDVKVSDGGDDSAYIVRAYNFVHGFEFPGGFQGPLYPIILGIFVKIMGINLPFLKYLSILFMLCFLFLFHKSFKKFIPATLLYPVMFIVSINSYLLYFASQTYSEAFFMMIQAAVFVVVFKYFISNEPEQINIKTDYKKFLILGFALFIASISKNVGYVSIFAVLAYFLIVKHWKTFLYTILSTTVFVLPFEIIKRIIWSSWEIQLESQGTGLFYKDYYNPAKGSDSFWDFISRIIDNSNLYLSKHLYIFLGFKSENTISPILTVFTYALFVFAFIYVFRKNKYLLFTGTYIGVMCAITFIILQKQWDQGRLIVIYYPYILLFIIGGIYYFLKNKNFKKYQFGVLILLPIIFITSFKATMPVIKYQKEILKKNLAGDILFGLTPDWINFIKMSEWAAENVPKEKLIASRKPDISFVYTGRKFYPVFKAPNITAEELTKKLNNDTLPISVAVEINDILPKNYLYNNNRYFIRAFISGSKDIKGDTAVKPFTYVVYSVTEKYSTNFFEQLNNNKIKYHENVSKLLTAITKEKYYFMIYDPDMVLNKLKKDNVRCFIAPKLRKTKIKSMGTIDTMDRLLHFMELKYPILKVIHTIGTDEETKLLEAQYELLSGDKDVIKGIRSRDLNSPDIKNYLDICKWAAKNLPTNELIASLDLGDALKQTDCKFYYIPKVTTITNEALTEKINKDSLPISVAVPLMDVFNKKDFTQFYANNRFYIKAFVTGNTKKVGRMKSDFTYIVYSFSKKTIQPFLKFLDEKKISYHTNLIQFFANLKSEKAAYAIYDPDFLIKKFKNDNVKNFVVGNIRSNPLQKGQPVQTMTLLLYFIELKYPIVKEIHRIGTEEEARILELQYSKVNKNLLE